MVCRNLCILPFHFQCYNDKLMRCICILCNPQLLSLAALKDWVSRTDIQKFDIVLCIGNKADLLPGHSAHVEYRRRMQKLGDSSFDSEFSDYGISETEGISLLGDEEPLLEITKSCLEWCTEHNIEYIEACASNADFDKCKTLHLPLRLSAVFHFFNNFISVCCSAYLETRKGTCPFLFLRGNSKHTSM